jgi:hypothetical protein
MYIFTPIKIQTMDAIGVTRTFKTREKGITFFWIEYETLKKEVIRRSFSEAGFRDIQIEF